MPRFVQRYLEWALDLPATPPGQGTAWRLENGAPPGSLGAWPTLGWVAAVAAVLIVLVYLREAPQLSWRRRLTLIALRLASAAALLIILSRASLRVDRTELPAVAVLLDVSGSMGLSDSYSDRRVANAVKSLTASAAASTQTPTRFQLASALLSRDDSRWLKRLAERHQVRLYAFDEHLRPLLAEPEQSVGTGVGALAAQTLPNLSAEGVITAPATALRELLSEHRGRALAGVILLTDGIASAGDEERLSVGAQVALQRGVPLFPIGVGSDETARDNELYDLLADDVAYAGDPVTLTVRLRSSGFVGRTSELRLTAEGVDGVLASRRVTLPGDGMPSLEELTFAPQQEGEYRLSVSLDPLPGESNVTNNVVRRRLTVRRDRFQVLLVEGLPRWEYRAVKPVFERDATVQLETFLQTADLNFAPEDRTALSALPATREQWERYDVVLWGDVDLSTLDRAIAERLQEFVRDHGGGLIFIAGEHHNPGRYTDPVWQTLLPVEADPSFMNRSEAGGAVARFRIERTVEGEAWTPLRLADEPAQDQSIWRSLPAEIDWFLPVVNIRPGAQVFATIPQGGVDQPVIVHRRYGRGQVLFQGLDSLWTWRKRVEDRYYGRYWSQVIRAMAAARVRQSPGNRELTSDRRNYRPGEEVRLRLRGAGLRGSLEEGAAAAEQVRLDSTSGSSMIVQMLPRAGAVDVWDATLKGLPVGEYTATLEGGDPDSTPSVCTFHVELPNRELRQRAIAAADLEQAARLTHGRYYSLADADDVPAAIPTGRAVRLTQSRPLPLWNRWELLLLLAATISTEWILRKQSRLV